MYHIGRRVWPVADVASVVFGSKTNSDKMILNNYADYHDLNPRLWIFKLAPNDLQPTSELQCISDDTLYSISFNIQFSKRATQSTMATPELLFSKASTLLQLGKKACTHCHVLMYIRAEGLCGLHQSILKSCLISNLQLLMVGYKIND